MTRSKKKKVLCVKHVERRLPVSRLWEVTEHRVHVVSGWDQTMMGGGCFGVVYAITRRARKAQFYGKCRLLVIKWPKCSDTDELVLFLPPPPYRTGCATVH